jgi:hypothetical protein
MEPSFRLGWCVPVLALGALSGCAMPPTPVQRAQQTAQDFNLDSRFGRNDLAMVRVDPDLRDEYAAHHKAWGSAIRVADIEMAGMKPKNDDDVDVFIHVAWYRMNEQELKQTTLKQHWHSKSDSWILTSEARLDGDVGLLGEPVVVQAPDAPRGPAQFPTIRLQGGAANEGGGGSTATE